MKLFEIWNLRRFFPSVISPYEVTTGRRGGKCKSLHISSHGTSTRLHRPKSCNSRDNHFASTPAAINQRLHFAQKSTFHSLSGSLCNLRVWILAAQSALWNEKSGESLKARADFSQIRIVLTRLHAKAVAIGSQIARRVQNYILLMFWNAPWAVAYLTFDA